jgi:SAM-dependent methyltransferase
VVYISHVIEHLSDGCAQFCFAEVHRCLKPGGVFRLTCPDIDLEYDAYCRRDSSIFPLPTPWRTCSNSIEQRFLEHFATALTLDHPETACHKFGDDDIRAIFSRLPKEEALDYFISQIPLDSERSHPEHHVNWFNVNKIERMLRKAGFENVCESRYGQSKCPLMRNTQLFDSTVPSLSLYLECQK